MSEDLSGELQNTRCKSGSRSLGLSSLLQYSSQVKPSLLSCAQEGLGLVLGLLLPHVPTYSEKLCFACVDNATHTSNQVKHKYNR